MATILEIARLANVSAENVLRVVNGEPVSSDVASRVAKTIEAVGPPPSPRSKADVVPADRSAGSEADKLVSRLARTAAELEAHLPQVGSILYEAVRVEVQPVSRHIAELDALFGLLVARLEDMRDEIDRERRERLEDVALLSELVSAGWRSADRRLARLEQMLTRLEEKFDDRRGPRSFNFPSAARGGSTGLNNGP